MVGGNPNVFHGKFRLRGGGGGVSRWEAAPLPCSVCRRVTDRRRRRRLAPLLAYFWTLALASRKATMFWTSVSRSESTGGRRRLALVQGSGRRRPSMPLMGALAPARGHALSTAHGVIHLHGHRHGRARQCTRRSMCWQVHGHRHGRARRCTRRCMRWQVHGHVKVGGDLVEPRSIKLGDNVRLQPINAMAMGAGTVGVTRA